MNARWHRYQQFCLSLSSLLHAKRESSVVIHVVSKSEIACSKGWARENPVQPEILALFDNNNPYANADSISRSTSVMKKVPKAGVAQTARPKRAYVCGLLS